MEKKSFNENIFIIAFVLMLTRSLLNTTSLFDVPSFLDNGLLLMYLFLMILKIVLQEYSIKSAICNFAVLLVVAIACVQAKYYTLFYSILGVVALQKVDINKVIRASYRIKASFLLFLFLVYWIVYAVDPSQITFVYRSFSEGHRHYFFFGHANTFACYVIWTCLEYIYVNYKKVNLEKLVLLWIINLIVHKFTDSNTALVVSTGSLALIACDKLGFQKIFSVVRFLGTYGFTICSVFFAFLVAGYTKFGSALLNVFDSVNTYLTGRLLYGAYVFDVYGLSWTGRSLSYPKKIHWLSFWFDEMVFDNVYIMIFLFYGVILLVLFSVITIIMGRKMNNLESVLLCFWVFYGVTEAYIIDAVICFPVLIIGMYLHKHILEKHEVEVKEKKNERLYLWQRV